MYPGRFAADLLIALIDVLGAHGADAVMRRAGVDLPRLDADANDLAPTIPMAQMGALNAAFDSIYGLRGGRGMALRIGRIWYARGMIDFGAMAGESDPAFRRLPVVDRLRLTGTALAEIFNRFSGQAMTTSEDDSRFCLHATPCAFAVGIDADRPVCHPFVGLLQEATRRAANGHSHFVRETACIAAGAPACTFVIDKARPLSQSE